MIGSGDAIVSIIGMDKGILSNMGEHKALLEQLLRQVCFDKRYMYDLTIYL